MSMSLTSTQTSTLTTAAERAALKALETGPTRSSSGAATTAASSNAAISSLTGNYNNFLTMLTTQLRDQDPTSPMSSDEFTSELVQFSGVEQQIQTNTNLGDLISLNQEQQLAQVSSLVGKQVNVSGNTVALQSGAATLDFTVPAAEPVAIAITNSGGQIVRSVQVDAEAGANSWTWNGRDDQGAALPDGPYTAALETIDQTGTTSAVAFSSVATPTSVQKSGTGFDVSFGPTTIDLFSVQGLAGS